VDSRRLTSPGAPDPSLHGSEMAHILDGGIRRRDEAACEHDYWPYTTRVLPWAICGFLFMLWLIPFDSTVLPIALPVDARLDRIALVALGAIWLPVVATIGISRQRLAPNGITLALGAFLLAALLSISTNAETLANLTEISPALKQVVLLVSYSAFYIVVATTIRPPEVPRYIKLTIGLACVAALGTIWQYRTGHDIFYEWTTALLPGAFHVEPPPVASDLYGRATIGGPTLHGLAITTILGMMLPFALMTTVTTTVTKQRLFGVVATTLLVAGAAATLRKTALIVPAVAVLVLFLYRPRMMVKAAPLGVAIVLMVQILSPGAISTIRSEFVNGLANSGSTQDRQNDYPAVMPDILDKPALGRGFGSYDSHKYRVLDNQYLGLTVETGAIGVATYVVLLASVGIAAHRAARSREKQWAVAAVAATAAFAVSNLLFDALAFPQAPYVFLFIAALVTATTLRPSIRDGEGARWTKVPLPHHAHEPSGATEINRYRGAEGVP